MFLLSKGVIPGQLNDMWMNYWDSLSVPEIQFNDRMNAWLGDLGYTGALPDRYAQWLIDTPITPEDCFEKPFGEYLFNWNFNCRLMHWGTASNYPATITDLGGGIVHLKTNSQYGSIVPDAVPSDAAEWILEVSIFNIIGNAKMSIRRPNNTWINHQIPGDGVHQMLYSGTIKEIHIGASNDTTMEADYDYYSLRKYSMTETPCMTGSETPYGHVSASRHFAPENVTYNGSTVTHLGETVTHND